MLDSPLPQPLSRSSLVFLLVWGPLLHTPCISSPSHHFLFATHAHTIAACSSVIPTLCHLFLISLSQLPTWITAKSSAYSSSYGRATLNSLDVASMTMASSHYWPVMTLFLIWCNGGMQSADCCLVISHYRWVCVCVALNVPFLSF